MVPKVVVFLAALMLFGCDLRSRSACLDLKDIEEIQSRLDLLIKQRAMQAPTGCFFLEAADAGTVPGLYVVQLMCPAGKPDVELAPVIKQAVAIPPAPGPVVPHATVAPTVVPKK